MKNNIRILFQTLFIIVVLFLLTSIPSYSAPPKLFAPVGARYVVTQSDLDLTNEVLTTQLDADIIASSSSNNIGSSLKPWGNVYGLFGLFGEVVSNIISAFGANQSISLNPTGTGKVLVGGDSLVVASKSSVPSSPIAGQIYFDSALGKFRGYNGTTWVDLSSAVPSPQPHTMTANGNAQVDTAQFKFGGASGLFDGIGDYLTTPDDTAWDFTATDATIDFWIRVNVMPTFIGTQFIGQHATNADGNWLFLLYSTGSIAIGRQGINEIATATGLITTDTWYHIAVVRINSSNTTKIFVDGVEKASSTTAVWNNAIPELGIGKEVASSDVHGLDGWMDEIRISNVARWTADFTPPSAAYSTDANTKLLIHSDGTDGSTVFTDVSQ